VEGLCSYLLDVQRQSRGSVPLPAQTRTAQERVRIIATQKRKRLTDSR